MPLPGREATLPSILSHRASLHGDRCAYRFLHDGETESDSLTYRELARRARALGALLAERGLAGERVILPFPPGLDLVVSFLGCLDSGAVAVPVHLPSSPRGMARLGLIVDDTEAAAVLAPLPVLARLRRWSESEPRTVRQWLAVEEIPRAGADDWRAPDLRPESVAFIQYTSGSTSDPKGVVVSHGNLTANERVIQAAFGQDESSVVVGWLPLFHDMGLIGNVLQTLFSGSECVLMSPGAFLQQPVRWLQAISRYRGTTSGGPNFAYDLCSRRVTPEMWEGLDLGSWEVAFNGAEPVRAETLERFARTFAPCGFRAEALRPCYGLAESTLLVSVSRPGERSSHGFQAAGLEKGLALAAGGAEGARVLVGAGWGGEEQRLAIVDAATGVELPPGEVGEIWVSGPSVAQGYWRKPEVSAELFAARLHGGGETPFLRTGDLGFLHGGQLFVTGRRKDLLIIRGRNHYPQDIERTAEASHPALRPGCGVAFAIERDGEEQLVVVHEVQRAAAAGDADVGDVATAVRRAVAEEHEIQVEDLVLVRPGTLPKTTSGKLRRAAARQAYLEGGLEEVGRSGRARGAGPEPLEPLALTAATDWLRQQLAEVLRAAPEAVDPDLPLPALGLDSLAAFELQGRLVRDFGFAVEACALLGGATLRELGDLLAERLEGAPAGPSPQTAAADDAAEEAGRPPIAAGTELPLSYGQQGLWLFQQLAPESAAYNLSGAVRIEAAVDDDALRGFLAELLDRHAVLRSTFPTVDGEPRQRVGSTERALAGFRSEPAEEWSESGLATMLAEEAARPFDLAGAPVLRVVRFRRSPAESVLLLVVHHVAADFRSLAILLEELAALLAAGREGRSAHLPPTSLSYGSYTERQRRELAGPAGEALWDYWRRQLAGDLPRLQLPADAARAGERTFRGGTVRTELEAALADRLRRVSRKEGVTLHSALMAAYALLLLRLGGQREVLVGSPAEGRTRPELAGLVGFFANPVVVRAPRPPATVGAAELLRTVQRTVLAALDHRELPFPLLAERLQPVRGTQPAAIFDALFVLHRERGPASRIVAALAVGEAGITAELSGLRLASCAVESAAAPFGLALAMAEVDGRLLAAWQHADDLLDEVTVRRMTAGFATLLGELAADPEAPAETLPLLTANERAQTLVEWNDTAAPAAGELRLHRLFEAQVARTPEAEALVTGEIRLSYRQLDERANRLARRLRRHGIAAEARVGVLLDRSADLVPALLGILKAGGAYVPLDPSYPADRLAFMAADAGVSAIVFRDGAAAGLRGRLAPAVRWVALDGSDRARDALAAGDGAAPDIDPESDPENLAYIIYTSGSTGRPKGVAIAHRSAAILLAWSRRAFSPRELAAVLAATSISFDLSVFEIFLPLSCGGKVVLARDALTLPALPAAGEVTLINTVPAAMAELLQEGGLPLSVRTVNLAGEPLPRDLAERLYAESAVERVVNLYGPTEDTTYSTWAVVARGGRRAPAIGRPIAGTRVYLLDAEMEPVPIGVAGELCLAGAGLARGYWGRPDLTAERFLPDAWSGEPGGRVYRTGDLARHLPQGDLDYLGRRDDQVKVRGFRIELAEIAGVLREHPGVAAAVVVAGRAPGGDGVLVAYVVSRAQPGPGRDELAAWLAGRLPPYMLPGVFVPLAALPLSPNGKLDRSRLPAPSFGGGAREPGTAPRTPVEELLAALWCDVLGVSAVRREDDFFALGGHSIKAARLAARIETAFGCPFALRAVFAAPTLAAMAGGIEAARQAGRPAAVPALPVPAAGERVPLSPAQHGLWQFDRLYPGTAVYNMPAAVDLEGELDAAALGRTLDFLLERHEILRTSFPLAAGQPWQRVAPPMPQRLPMIDLGALPEPVRGPLADALADAEARRPFDLQAGPLLRTTLLCTGPAAHTLHVVVHHTVADGASIEVFLRELAGAYGGFAARRLPELPPPVAQYAGHTLGQHRRPAEDTAAALSWWRERLAGAAPLDLPTDRPQPPVADRRGEVVGLPLEEGLGDALAGLGRQHGASPLMVFLAGFQALLGRYTGQADIVVGLPVALRDRQETEQLIGLFVHVLPVRTPLVPAGSFTHLLAAVREAVLGAYEHRELPFQELVERLDLPAEARRQLDPRAVLDLEAEPPVIDLPGLRLAARKVHTGTAKFDLSLGFVTGGDAAAAVCELRTALFDRATVERLLGHLAALLAGAAADPRASLAHLPLLSVAEREQMLSAWGEAPAVIPPDELPVHRQFEQQAAERPWAPAVVAGDIALTYGELDRRADLLAHRLRSLGVGAESVVALSLDRSPEYLIGIVGVLKAGGAYLPLDPAWPSQRLEALLAGSGARVVLARDGERRLVEVPGVVQVDPDAAGLPGAGEAAGRPEVLPDSLAYLIYTSGSTGAPKAVAVEHASLANLVAWHRQRFAVTSADRATQLAGLSFDASVWEVWPYLASGSCLYLPDDDTLASASRLVDWLSQHEITVCFLPTPVLEAVLPHLAGRAPALRYLLTGGDRLRQRPAPDLSFTLVNQYGPTECAVVATSGVVAPGTQGSPPLGRPIDNLRLRLLDAEGEPVPVGVPGEIHLGGRGLARGYHGRPELTADRFRPDPFGAAGARLYRTGDLARYRPSGDLEFLGRTDHQVKIRGFRVEIGEIEASLAAHPGVVAGVVAPRVDRGGSTRLVAYIVPRAAAAAAPADLLAFLGERLPPAMLPSAVVPLAELPLTRHGKIDRAALAEPVSFESGRRRPFVAPRSAFEETLAEVWREILEVDPIGVHDSFYELGGHSLQILRLLARVQELFGVEVPVSRLDSALTVEHLAVAIAMELAQAADRDLLTEALADFDANTDGALLAAHLPEEKSL